MGGRGSSYLRQQTSEEGLDRRATEIHRILNEVGLPARQSISQTKEMLRLNDRRNGYVFNKRPDPDRMENSDVYREIDRVAKRIDKKHSEAEIIKFKKTYNQARSKYNKGDVAGAEKQLSKVPYDYIRYRALTQSMYGYPDDTKKRNFYKAFH